MDIDFNKPTHVKSILNLSNKNDFYKDQIKVLVGGDDGLDGVDKFFNQHKDFMKLLGMGNIEVARASWIKMNPKGENLYKNDKRYGGKFICKDKRALGFALYYKDNVNNNIDIKFLLVTKGKQNRGLGTKLVNSIKSEYTNKNIITQPDNNYLKKWYIKRGVAIHPRPQQLFKL